MITWGNDIAVDGKRPAWLKDDEKCLPCWSSSRWYENNGARVLAVANWPGVTMIRLPSDHFAYTAINAGFEPWGGGDKAPDDWDGGPVLLGSGQPGVGNSWDHNAFRKPHHIIGYKRKAQAVDVPEWAVKRAASMCNAEDVTLNAFDAFARYIAEHEQPPVDPDVLAMREILAAWHNDDCDIHLLSSLQSGYFDDDGGFQAAIAVYRKHKGK